MATTTVNGDTYPSTGRGVSEGEVWDGMDRSPTFFVASRDEAAALDNMCQPAIDARYENLNNTIRDLEAAIARRNTELVDKRSALIYETNRTRDLEARVESLLMSIDTLENRLKGYERDMSGTMKVLEDARDANARSMSHIAELQGSLAMMTEMAETAAKDADAHMNTGAELSDMLNDSGKREDRLFELVQGIRALAESNMLTDHEKVSLILRLA